MAQLIKRTTGSGEARYDVRARVDVRVVCRTFRRRKDADAYIHQLELDRLQGVAVDPKRAQVLFAEYAHEWLGGRPDLRPTTRAKYEHLLRRHINPQLGGAELGRLTPGLIRSWYAGLHGRHPATTPTASSGRCSTPR